MKSSATGRARTAGGVQSVEIGADVLQAVVTGGGPLSLKTISEVSGLPPAKAHRYLVSLIRSGLVEQDEATGKYDLGAMALQVGLAAILRLNVVRTAVPILAELRERLGETVMLTVWGDYGPTIVYWDESQVPVTVNARIGSVLPLLGTATGHVYLAWLPRKQTQKMVRAEQRQRAGREPIDAGHLIERTRGDGLGHFEIEDMRSLSSMAAPIFDVSGKLAAVVTAFGYKGDFENSPTGANARALKSAAAQVSLKMGFSGEPPQDG